MKIIETALSPIDGYLISIKRNTMEGWYELEIGIPSSWVFDENNIISCEIVREYEEEKARIVKIAPKKLGIVIDDLVEFIIIILETNKKIAEKEKEFTNKMEEMKGLLESEAKSFYQELDELKERSFKEIGYNFTKTIVKPKRGRPVGSTKKKHLVTNVKNIVVEETTDLGQEK